MTRAFGSMEEPLLDASRLAAHVGVSLRQVRTWIAAGEIPHDVLPCMGTKRKVRRFKASEVETWLSRVEPGSRKTYNPCVGLYRYKTGKNKSSIWHYKFSLDGQRVYGSTGTIDHVKAREIYVAAHNAALEGRRQPKGKITFGDASAGYLQWSAANNKPSTSKEKVCASRAMLRYFDKNRRLTSIGVSDIEDYKTKRRSETARHGKGVPSGATVNRSLTFLQGLFTWAKKMGKIEHSPFDTRAITKFKEQPLQVRHLQPEEQQRLIKVCSEKLRPVVVVGFATGLRMGELRALSWRQVDLGQRVIHVIMSKSRNRAIRLGAGLVELFKRLPKRSEFVFTHEAGEPLSKSFIDHEFGRALDRAEIQGFSFHGLRRVFATNFYSETKDIRKLQRVLGHSSIATTERYLATLGIVEDSQEVDAISESILSPGVRIVLGLAKKDVDVTRPIL